MRYISTRGGAAPVGFVEALLAGLAPDGGLYVPEAWPVLAPEEIAGFAGKPYARVAADILGRFAGEEIAPEVMVGICEAAYATFSDAAVAPLRKIDPRGYELQLFHGPTLAFKDVAMQVLARFYEHALATRGRTMTIVCATSGDTGGAAVEAFAGRDNMRIVALFPEGRVSEVQRRFMTTNTAANVRCVAVAGDFDACQTIVKGLFADRDFAAAVDLSAVNSINFARIAAQTVYYFTAAAALGAPGQPVSFSVPSGNFGNAFAGWAATRMGLPIERIIVATNTNAIVARALETGVYERGEAVATQSPAMDIQVASNFERLYFEASGRDAVATATAFEGFAKSGNLTIPPAELSAMRALFRGVSVSERETSRAIADDLGETLTLIDPHTAVAEAGAGKGELSRSKAPFVFLATAHPAKFPDAVLAAARKRPVAPPAALAIEQLPERFDRLSADAAAVKAYIRAFVNAT